MKTTIQKLWIIIAMLCASAYASAYDFVSEGIAYTITSLPDLECSVSSADVLYEGDIIIPAKVNYRGKQLTVVSIGDKAFENSAVTSVTLIPKSLCKIGYRAFADCNLLRSILLNEGLQTIDDEAFSGCSLLQSINFPKTVQSIGEGCFYGCTLIETIVLPNTLTKLGSSAFKKCTNLRKVTLSGLITLEAHTFEGCINLNSVTLSGLSTLEAYTFNGCVNLNSVTWDDNLQSIGSYAFSDCGFESFQIPNSVTSIGKSILSGNKRLQSFTIGNGLNEISSDPIEDCPNVKNLIIADGDKSLELNFSGGEYKRLIEGVYISPGAYADTDLEYVYVGRAISPMKENIGYYTEYYTLPPFHGNKSIKTVEIGPKVLSLRNVSISVYDYGWLEDCTNLETVRFLGMRTIRKRFAPNATSLKYIEFSDSTENIEESAFFNCPSLETVILGTNVSSIGRSAFYNNSIASIYCKAKTPPTCETNNFPNTVYLHCNLYIPSGTEDAYKQTSPWNNFWNICEETGIANIYGEDIKIWLKENSLYISGKKESQIVEIYNTQGQLVESTTASIIEMKSKGTFIVKIGSWAQKIML